MHTTNMRAIFLGVKDQYAILDLGVQEGGLPAGVDGTDPDFSGN